MAGQSELIQDYRMNEVATEQGKLQALHNHVVSKGKKVGKKLRIWVDKNAPAGIVFAFNKMEKVINKIIEFNNHFVMLPQV